MQTAALGHFATSPPWSAVPGTADAGCPSRIRTSVHGSKVRCPTTRRRGSGPRKEEWSGRRDSNPRPSPWQGDALPTEPLPLERSVHPVGGAESQDRTGDTAIFSRVLYQLSYLGPMANQPSAARRRVERYHGPPDPSNDGPSPACPYGDSCCSHQQIPGHGRR